MVTHCDNSKKNITKQTNIIKLNIFSRSQVETVLCVEASLLPSKALVISQTVNVQSRPAGIVSIHSVDLGAPSI